MIFLVSRTKPRPMMAAKATRPARITSHQMCQTRPKAISAPVTQRIIPMALFFGISISSNLSGSR